MLTLLLIFAAAITFAAILIFGIMITLKSSIAYGKGVEKAKRSAAVITLIGEPVKEGLFIRGGVRGGGSITSLYASLYGPKGRGKLQIRALKSGEELQFEILKFYSGGEVVDLLSEGAVTVTQF